MNPRPRPNLMARRKRLNRKADFSCLLGACILFRELAIRGPVLAVQTLYMVVFEEQVVIAAGVKCPQKRGIPRRTGSRVFSLF
jgi:hypothetical protein